MYLQFFHSGVYYGKGNLFPMMGKSMQDHRYISFLFQWPGLFTC